MTVQDRTRLTDEATPAARGIFHRKECNMKKQLICGLLLLAAMLPFLPSCAKSDPLYSVTDGDRTVTVLGGGGRANYLTVSENGSEIWRERIYADRTVGERGGTFGLRVMDVNFDGRNDLVIAITVKGEATTEQVFLRQSDGSYRLSTAFEGKCNLAVDARQELVFGFSHTDRTERDVSDDRTYHVITDVATAYSWQGSTLVPRRYVALIYYGGSDRYCYAVADYDETVGAWKDSDDHWMTPEQYAEETFDALYYFRDNT